MKSSAILPSLLALLFASSVYGQDKGKGDVFVDPALAGAEFKLQGEYEGEMGDRGKFGVQVVALGDGKFDLYFLQGGLPGAGWDAKTRLRVAGTLDGAKAKFADKGYRGDIIDGQIKGSNEAGEKYTFKQVVRKSPTLGAKPPQGATVLFDGTGVDEWKNGKLVDGKFLNWGVSSKKSFAAGKYHLEFRTPFQPKARGQGRGNSGVYILGTEIQVLDSFGLTGAKYECGALYGNAKPAVNMCLPPLSWQTYDVDISADADGNAVMSVLHNGVKVHDQIPLGRKVSQPATINLQNHGNPVYFQNIWVMPKK